MSVGEAYTKWLTPQEQEALKAGCTLAFFDEWNLVESWKPESILATRLGKHLPKQYACIYTPLFLKQFGVCVVTVAWKLAQPKPLPLASVAEELAAWTIVEEAKEVVKRESGEAPLAAPTFQAFIDGYFEDTHFLSLFERDMQIEAVSAGLYYSIGWGKDYPRIQILTIAELLQGAEVKMPPPHGTFKSAPRVQKAKPEAQQARLGFYEESMEQR